MIRRNDKPNASVRQTKKSLDPFSEVDVQLEAEESKHDGPAISLRDHRSMQDSDDKLMIDETQRSLFE